MKKDIFVGQKWLCDNRKFGLARFYFVILGPGKNLSGKKSSKFKLCKLEMHRGDRAKFGYKFHGKVINCSHSHIKKYAKLIVR